MTREIIIPSFKWNPTTSAFELEADTDLQVLMGRLALTTQRTSDYVTLSHYDQKTGATSYAIAFDPWGGLRLNATTGRSVTICNNDSSIADFITEGIFLYDDKTLFMGNSYDSGIGWSSNNTVNALLEFLGDTSMRKITTRKTYRQQNFDLPVAVNPTHTLFADVDPDTDNTQYADRSHNGSDAEYNAGKGGHVFSADGNQKVKLTALGGVAVKLTNKTGAVSVAGQQVKADSANDDSIILTAINDVECFGVFLDDGVADGSEAWVVTSGIADVRFGDNVGTTRGNWVGTGASAGNAQNQTPPPGAVALHFQEIGHCIETVAATGVGTFIKARCILHFN